MIANHLNQLDDECGFSEAVTAYLKAIDAGQSPDPQEWLERYPEVATELADFFAGHEQLDRLSAPLRTLVPVVELTPFSRSGRGKADDSGFIHADSAGSGQATKGCVFGDYQLLDVIAQGGMGIIYKARQLRPNRIVALKLILSGQLARRSDVERFQGESEAAASLDHPHIVPIYEVGQHQGQYYFSMKLVEGQSLAQRLRDREERAGEASAVQREASEAPAKPQTPHRASSKAEVRGLVKILTTVARAVHYAHQRGILHRDLKPGNILLDGADQPYVTDFGLAKQFAEDQTGTLSGTILGTASYMAPEQAAGSKVLTTAADIYGLGAILYEMLTGRPPFRAATPLETIIQVRNGEPASPRAVHPQVDRDLETICLKCLDKDPRRRYGSAEAIAEELDRWLAGEPIQARPVGRVERLWRWCRRNPAPTAASGLAVVAFTAVVALAVGSVFAVQLGEEQERTQAALQQAESQQEQTKAALQLAEAQQGIAEQKGDEADRQRQRAEDQEKLARHYLYGAHILLAQRAWDSNHVDLTLDYLERHIPQRAEDDVRGFEWHYLWRRAHADLLTLKTGTSQKPFAFTADGKQLLTPMPDGQVQVWDAATGKEVATRKEAQPQEGTAVQAFSSDGQRVASGTKNGSIKVWDVATGQEVITLKGHDNEIRLLAFSPDGKRLASAAVDKRTFLGVAEMKTRKVWDLATGREIVTINHDLKPGYQWSLLFSPDGTRLASGSLNALKIWDATTGQEVRSIDGLFGPITVDIAFSPDGKRLAAGSQNGTAMVWDATTGQELFTLKGHISPVWSVSFSPDGKRLATGSKDATAKVWEMATGKEIGAFKGHRGDVWNVAYSPDGMRLASGSTDKTVKIWDATALAEGRTIKTDTGFVYAVEFSPDGKRLAAAGSDSDSVWDVATGQQTLTLKSSSGFGENVAFSPDGKQMVTDSQDGTIRIWDAASGQEIRSFKEKSGIGNLAFSPDGKVLVFGSRPDGIKLIDAATGKELLTSKDGVNMAGGIKFSPDGKRLAASKNDVNVLDATDGKVLLTLRGHTAYCIGVAFSPDGKWLASGSWDNTAKLWDASTGQEVLTLKGHTGYVTFVTFSPDSKRLATMSPAPQDQTIKLWDTSTGQELLTLQGATNKPVFSPDGKLLASGGRDGSIRIWDATPLPEESPAK